ncbi:hypothetical protein LZL87_013463 [Fusarium oxysporum]|nr:hypothetical protein LZL87_013463 [Fusarium oxysporum]
MSVFDREEHNWHIHLNGAKEIIRRQRFTDTPGSSSDFLLTWWLYHDVLAAFNHPSWRLNESPGSVSTPALYTFSGDNSLIVGSLGCSVEVLEIIDEINMMRLHSAHDCLSTSTLQRCDLAMKLFNLRQLLAPLECSDSLRSHRILAIAELYRLATLLYLQRVHPIAEDDFTRPVYVQQALGVLKNLGVATSPWPVFVIACEVDEQDRVSILHTLDRMDSVRSIGNIKVLRDVIESIWKQQDLRNIGKSAHARLGRPTAKQASGLKFRRKTARNSPDAKVSVCLMLYLFVASCRPDGNFALIEEHKVTIILNNEIHDEIAVFLHLDALRVPILLIGALPGAVVAVVDSKLTVVLHTTFYGAVLTS